MRITTVQVEVVSVCLLS